MSLLDRAHPGFERDPAGASLFLDSARRFLKGGLSEDWRNGGAENLTPAMVSALVPTESAE
jgi:hypothetical protein